MRDEQRARIVRCERHGLVYDPETGTGCVLCRSESRGSTGLPRMDRLLTGLLAAIVILLVGAVAVQLGTPLFERALGPTAASAPSPPAAGEPPPAASPAPKSTHATAPGGLLPLHTQNLVGRSGTLYLPKQIAAGPRPLFVLFHGTGGSGAQIVSAFLAEAEARGVILLAPDSGRSPDGAYNWQVPDKQGDTSADQTHVAACLEELFAAHGPRINPALVFTAGHSGGASSAAYLATNDERFRGFAVLHGGVFPGGLGSHRASGWFSTGSADPLRPPSVLERAAAASAPHATTVSTHVYPGGHELTATEIHELVVEWLGP